MVELNENGWHLPSVNEGLRIARVCNGQPMPGDTEAGEANHNPTDDAYLRVCRALHWAQGQLRAHGIEPDPIAPDAPHYPPEDHVYQSLADRAGGEVAIAIGEHAFRAGFGAGQDSGVDAAGGRRFATIHEAWSEYDPPEHIKALS